MSRVVLRGRWEGEELFVLFSNHRVLGFITISPKGWSRDVLAVGIKEKSGALYLPIHRGLLPGAMPRPYYSAVH